MPRGRPAPSGTEWILLGRPSVPAKVVPEQCCPRFSAAGIDHSKERPHCAVWLPRISILLLRAAGEGTRHKSPRRREIHADTDAVAAARGGPDPLRPAS